MLNRDKGIEKDIRKDKKFCDNLEGRNDLFYEEMLEIVLKKT